MSMASKIAKELEEEFKLANYDDLARENRRLRALVREAIRLIPYVGRCRVKGCKQPWTHDATLGSFAHPTSVCKEHAETPPSHGGEWRANAKNQRTIAVRAKAEALLKP